MPFAICLKAENDTARPILALWDEVGRLEPTPSMSGLGYPPHLTLAIYDEVGKGDALAALNSVFSGLPPIVLGFEAICWFENQPLVLWAAPGANASLLLAHDAIHRTINPALCRPYSRPGHWVPHCTLGTAIPNARRDEAYAMTQRTIDRFEVTFDVADVVCFPPVEVIAENVLR